MKTVLGKFKEYQEAGSEGFKTGGIRSCFFNVRCDETYL